MLDPKFFLVNLDKDLCLSGGALGADLQWGMTAGSADHMVIHWSFPEHTTYAPEAEVVRLDEDQLSQANLAVERAAKSLNRKVPKDKYIRNLIRRSFFQVRWAGSLYVVGTMKNKGVEGGTAWAVQMYIDRLNSENVAKEDFNLYFFNQVDDTWYSWEGHWTAIESPPKPRGIWAGIGTRKLSETGKQAIRSLMGWRKP